ncbi:MAG: class I SAM-dependent RNA methyltransferase [Anaerolineales bacterium]
MKEDAAVTLLLERFAYGGEALGRLPDGRIVFVPYALPGERVRARIVAARRGRLEAELLEVIDPAPERERPRCRHFGVCGGCHYQHLPYAAQTEAKAAVLGDLLRRIGKIEAVPLRPVVAAPQAWNYRNHVQFHLTPDGRLGFMEARSAAVLPIQECHLPEGPLNDLWPALQFEAGLGLERVSLRLGADGEAMVVFESPEVPALELEADLSVVHLRGGEALVLAGDQSLTMSVRGRAFRVSAGSFFQVNTAMAERMVHYLLERLPLTPQAAVLDVYCGVGLFSAFLAERVGRLIGIEAAPSACEDFAVNLDEFENVELYEGAAEEVLPALSVRPQVVLVDPPRAGLERRALEALLALGAKTLAYVSCDPATLARDARRLLDGGYRLVEVTPFDLFPQTYHIESISLFEKPG